MNALRLAALAAFAMLASPAAALPVLALSCAPAQAGNPEPCTISRVSGSAGVYVLFATQDDGTAKAGVDYTSVNQLIYFPASQSSVVVNVPTLSDSSATGTLSFSAAVTAGLVAVRTTASIVEPAPAPQWVPAAFKDGGYARCINQTGCRGLNAPYPAIIANYGDVMMFKWNGWSAATYCGVPARTGCVNDPGYQVGAFFPKGQYMVAGVGVEGRQDDWQGVMPA